MFKIYFIVNKLTKIKSVREIEKQKIQTLICFLSHLFSMNINKVMKFSNLIVIPLKHIKTMNNG